ncbi:HdeD family acid-resistance protein [Demequina flava]|uniref:HdeD family acid-resistance protein n=1 Tax=Demequina flava TaxID=1095025 RepID=UPI0007818D98|nr:DUF308 domain-containing protein [Demequina flava]
MTQPRFPDDLGFDPETMTRKAVNAARVMMGVMGIIGVLIGIALLVWPGKSLGVLAVFAGIFFAITGAVRISVGIFSRDVSSGSRILNIIIGIFLLLGGVVMLKNLTTSTEVLTVMVVILIGIGWVIEGVATLAQAGRSSASTMAYVRGAIAIIAGIVLIAVPTWSALALVIMTGITILLLGIVGIVQAFVLGKNLPTAGSENEHQVING